MNTQSWSWSVRIGTGRTLQSAIEHAISAAKLPPPLRFEVLTIGGTVSKETELWYEVRVKVRSEAVGKSEGSEPDSESLEDTAARRSVGTGEVLS